MDQKVMTDLPTDLEKSFGKFWHYSAAFFSENYLDSYLDAKEHKEKEIFKNNQKLAKIILCTLCTSLCKVLWKKIKYDNYKELDKKSDIISLFCFVRTNFLNFDEKYLLRSKNGNR